MKKVFYDYHDLNKEIILNKYIPLTVEEAVDILQSDEIKDFRVYVTYEQGENILFFISKEKIPRIFVVKRDIDREDRYSNEKKILEKITKDLSDGCREVLNIGSSENIDGVDVIVMEYFDGNLAEIVSDLYEDERREILGKVVVALECFDSKNLAYTDLKLQQVLFRQKEDSFYDIKLTDFEVTNIEDSLDSILMTYKLPDKYYRRKNFSPYIDLYVVWGLLVFVLSLWTFSSIRQEKNIVKLLGKPRKLFKYLERITLPKDVREFVERTYNNLENTSMENVFEELKIIAES